ncbi:MAG: LysE family translocator [Canibacter sp.]
MQGLRHLSTTDVERESAPTAQKRLFLKGIGISLLNPKVFLLFLALLPQFVSSRTDWSLGLQMVVLGMLHVANCALVYFAVGYGANTLFARQPKAAKIVNLIASVVMIGLGLFLVVEKLFIGLQ